MKKTFVGVLAASALLLAGCGSDEPDTLSPTVTVSGITNKATEGSKACKFYEGTVRDGAEVIMRGADDRIFGKTSLAVVDVHSAGGDKSMCVFEAKFDDIPPGEAAYQVQVSGFDQVIFTEDEIRDGANITYRDDLSAAFDKLGGK